MKIKRKYEEISARRIAGMDEEHKRFLIETLRKEWEELDRLEKVHERRRRLIDLAKTSGLIVAKTILITAALGGIIVVAAAAPNVFSAFDRTGKRRRFLDAKTSKRSIYYLKRQRYIETVKKDKNNYEIVLTKSGLNKVLSDASANLKIPVQEKWDGIWRLVIFDIPHKHRYARDGFRRRLRAMGLYPLQKSAFVTPYPCREEIDFCSSLFNASNYVCFIETSKLEPDEEIKKVFSLS